MSIKSICSCLKVEIEKKNDDQITELLDTLCETTISLSDLKQTGIGKVVNGLRKNKDPSIAKTASTLVGQWKELAKPYTKKASGQRPVKKKKPAPSIANAMARVSSMTGNQTRDVVRKKMVDALKPDNIEDCLHYEELAYSIEDAMYEKWGSTRKYTDRYRDLVFNLRNSKNPELNQNILYGNIPPKMFIEMSADELASSKMASKRKESRDWQTQANRCDIGKATAEMTDDFKCGKCYQRRCSYYQQQTRGADEPMTVFVTCLECGNRWKC